jgi:hypothetical protein
MFYTLVLYISFTELLLHRNVAQDMYVCVCMYVQRNIKFEVVRESQINEGHQQFAD